MQDIFKKAIESAAYISKKIDESNLEIAIIAGSGLGPIADIVTERVEIPYSEIPNFPSSSSTVEGHSNKLVIGKIAGKGVAIMQGRFHYYEGYEINEVAFPIKVFAMLGIKKLIASNAAGGINKDFKIGDLMLLSDHINICGITPLRGPNEPELGIRFPSMRGAYSDDLREIAKNVASKLNFEELADGKKISLREGVYAFMPGPQYETRAEINMLSILGADAVGMSTVPEVINAVHSGMSVLGISCITNLCCSDVPPSHEEVLITSKSVEKVLQVFVTEIIKNI